MKDTQSVAVAKVKEQNKTGAGVGATKREVSELDLEMSKAGLTVILAVGAAIGVLGLLFLMGGLMSAGNPLNFVSQWVKAVLGG